MKRLTVDQQLHRVFSGDWQGAAFFHSITCRIICSLNGHDEQALEEDMLAQSFSYRTRDHIRQIFWVCYMLDKDISLRTGNPPILTDVYCGLAPPDPDSIDCDFWGDLNEIRGTDDEQYQNLSPHFLGDPCLSHLKEKACQQLFSVQATNDNDNQLLLHIRELDLEIEHWRLSIPEEFRPALVVPQSTPSHPPDVAFPTWIRQMSLQLEYHHLMTVVHTMVRKCRTYACYGMGDLHDVVHSSFDLSLEASRSTIWCLKVLISTIKEEALR